MTTTRKSLRRDMGAAATDRTVERVSPVNRDFARRIVRQKRNEGWREPTACNWAHAMLRLDEQLGQRPFPSATPDDMAAILNRLRRVWKRPSLRQFSIHVKAAFRDIFNADLLPRDWNKALLVRQEKWTQARKLVTSTKRANISWKLTSALIGNTRTHGRRVMNRNDSRRG